MKGYTYDVRPISAQEVAAVSAMPRVDALIKRDLGLSESEFAGERLEDAIMRLAIVVRGL